MIRLKRLILDGEPMLSSMVEAAAEAAEEMERQKDQLVVVNIENPQANSGSM